MKALKDCELLAPAGDKNSFYAAIAHGANAVYLGTSDFSARASAENFSLDELGYYIKYAHFFGVKVHVALNTIVKQNELEKFPDVAAKVCAAGADALIVQDIFLAPLLRERCPGCELHLSTQAGVNNAEGALIAKRYGFSRVIPARETPIHELTAISAVCETEAFVQGALCTAFSGQCYMSSFAGGYSGNRGRCKQPCRREYVLAGEKRYALSTSDLCVGERVKELCAAGVTAFKIEGRMRRAEYVAAAVDYYREILDTGVSSPEKKSALMRAYNRGDYTEGLNFGQKNDFLSPSVQGHIGECVGKVTAIKGNRISVSGNRNFTKDDCFKILRGMKETGSAVATKSGKGSEFVLVKQGEARPGDSVRITTDVSLFAALTAKKASREIKVFFRAAGGEKAFARAECAGRAVIAETEEPLREAASRALTADDVKEIFLKTDNYPYSPVTETEITGKIFAARSVLNALRRELYAKLFDAFAPHRAPSTDLTIPACPAGKASGKLAVIAEDFSFAPKARPFEAIFSPADYNDDAAFEAFFKNTEGRKKYLYVPALLGSDDERIIAERIKGFDGVYGENLAAIALKEKYGVGLFAGTGFNIFNGADIAGITEFTDKYAYSKELSLKEIRELNAGGYLFTRGDVKVMDLGYCPYGKRCDRCNAPLRDVLTDYAGRKFKLRRIRLASCRFEIYNPQILCALAPANANLIFNAVLRAPEEALTLLNASDKEVKSLFECTAGASVRGVL